jgi:hypothetical protein
MNFYTIIQNLAVGALAVGVFYLVYQMSLPYEEIAKRASKKAK